MRHTTSTLSRIAATLPAAAAGIPAWLIKVLGHWSSDC